MLQIGEVFLLRFMWFWSFFSPKKVDYKLISIRQTFYYQVFCFFFFITRVLLADVTQNVDWIYQFLRNQKNKYDSFILLIRKCNNLPTVSFYNLFVFIFRNLWYFECILFRTDSFSSTLDVRKKLLKFVNFNYTTHTLPLCASHYARQRVLQKGYCIVY